MSSQKEVQKPPLKISMIQSAPPFSITLADGHITGLYAEFWRLWSRVNDREIEFVVSEFGNNIDDLKNSRVDFHSGLFKNPERETWAEFSIPFHEVKTSLYFYEQKHKRSDFKDMAGKKVAVRKNSYQAEYFTSKYPDVKFHYFTDSYKVIVQLLEGQFDAIIGEEPYIDNVLLTQGINGILYKSTEKLLTNFVHALFPKENKHLINEINNGIKNIPIDKIIELERKWIQGFEPYFSKLVHQSIPSLTLNEIEWIKNLPEILVGSDSNWPPIEFVTDKVYQGVAIDFLNIIHERLDINFKHSRGFEWVQLMDKAKNGEIKILSAVVEQYSREDNLILTEPYAQFQVVAMVRPDSPLLGSFLDMRELTIGAVLEGELKSILEEKHPDIPIKNTVRIMQGLKDLSDGTIDVFLGNHFMIAHYLEKFKDSGLKVALFTKYKVNLKMEVHKQYEKLVPILNKLFASISNRERTAILNHWKGNEIIEINDQYEQFLTIGIPTFLAILLLLFYVTYLNRQMNSEIVTRKIKEAKLQDEKEVADRANRAKDDFLANMSHELRSPMNAIVGSSFLLESSSLTHSQNKLVEVMNTSAKSLLRLINNILDLSKIEAEKLELEEKKTDVRILCENLFEQEFRQNVFGEENLQDNVELNLHIDTNIPKQLILDSYRLKQILSNLIFNAKKYTQLGKISLIVSKVDEDEKKHSLLFEVVDTGIGINSEQLVRLFSNYNQTDASLTRKNSGAGLGLKLTYALCKLMGSELKIESSLGNGSRFYFTIQTKWNTDFELIQDDSSSRLTNLKVLIVDDSPVNLIVAKKTLEKMNLLVVTANSGSEAISLLEKSNIQVVLMDMYMPGMDGAQTTKKIREGHYNPQIPIYALSASTNEEEKNLAKNAGMNGYLNKPIDVEQLTQVLVNEAS
ncbi:MAG: hypothetical protein COA86_06425 [Kangiella sp.]|nr:MAG: hypothetical protein COA86_06425 [Kangiella sp.]